MVGQRTRTGCKTCRARKLKCDENKPVCGQCRKSNRECVPSEGVAFRHAQNAGFNDENGGESLKSFYKYRQKFENPYFLPVPKELTFIQISDPFAEEQVMSTPSHTSATPKTVVPTSIPPVQMSYMPRNEPGYVDVAASSLKAMIDPNLEASTAFGNEGHEMHHAGHLEGLTQINENISTNQAIIEAENDGLNEKIMKALQHSNEQVKRS